MAIEFKTIKCVIPTSGSLTVDYIDPGFGTPQAAILFAPSRDETYNPGATPNQTIGVIDSSFQGCIANRRGSNSNASTRYQNLTNCYAIANAVIGSGVFALGQGALINDGIRITYTTYVSDFIIFAVLVKGAKNIKAGRFIPATDTSVKDINDIGFKPTVVMPFSADIDDGTNLYNAFTLNYGFVHNSASDVITQCCISVNQREDNDPAKKHHIMWDSYGLGMYWSGGSTVRTLTFSDFDSQGFSVKWNVTAGSTTGLDRAVIYLAFEMDDPDNVSIDLIQTPTANGSQQYNVGISPQFVFTIQSEAQLLNTVVTDGAYAACSFFSAFGSGVDFTEGFNCQITSNGNAYANTYPSAIGANYADTVGDKLLYKADLVGLTPAGFDLNWTNTAANQFWVLALSIGDESGSAKKPNPLLFGQDF